MRIGSAIPMILLLAGPAVADPTSQTLFQHKNWEVEVVTFDDGSRACLAQVDAVTDSFTVWVYQDASFKLQFYSQDWQFGDPGTTANLQVEIDRRGAWNISDAQLVSNSVLIELPDSDSGVRFLTEVARGNNLLLASESGEGVKRYSLAGSSASMQAMLDCGSAITSGSSGSNPFQ